MMTRSLKLAASAFAALLTLTAAAPVAQAQQPGPEAAKITVPFAFEIGSKHFAPGVYNLALQSAHLLCVRGATDSATLMINPDSTLRPAATGKAVFERIGSRFFLTQVYSAGSTNYIQTVKTAEMKQARRAEQASLRTQPTSQPDTITLALLR